MVAGVLIANFLPATPAFLCELTHADIAIPVVVLIWLIKPFRAGGIGGICFLKRCGTSLLCGSVRQPGNRLGWWRLATEGNIPNRQ